MASKIKVENQELLVLLEFENSKYEKIIMCLDENNKKVFVIDNKIVIDKKKIDEINTEFDLEMPEELKNFIY